MDRFELIAAAVWKYKFGPLNFPLLIDVLPKYRVSCGIWRYAEGVKLIYAPYLFLRRYHRMKWPTLQFFEKSVDSINTKLKARFEGRNF